MKIKKRKGPKTALEYSKTKVKIRGKRRARRDPGPSVRKERAKKRNKARMNVFREKVKKMAPCQTKSKAREKSREQRTVRG